MRLTIPQHQVTLSGNTAGALAALSSGTVTLAGGNAITLSQVGNAVTIIGPSLTESQTFIGGISASDTLYTSGTVRLTGSNAVTVRSGTGQLVVIDVPTQSVQPETQTFVGGIANSQTTYTSGTISLSELGAITIRSTTGNQYQLSVNSQSVQPETQTFVAGVGNSQTTYSSGTVNLSVVAGNLTIRSTTGQAFQFSMSQTVQPETQTAISGIANSQTTYTSGTVSLSELGAITIRSTTGNQYQFSVNSQTAQTQSNIQALYDGANSIQTGTVRLTDANGVTFSINAQTLSASVNQSISMFAVSNTTQSTSGTAHKSALSFGGAGIASVGVTGGSVVISVPAGGGAGDGGVFAGVSTGGNTAGSTGTVSTGNFVLVGNSPISLSQSTGAAGSAATVSINAPATSSLSATGGVSISTNGSTISIGVPVTSKVQWNPWQGAERVAGQIGQGTLHMQPYPIGHALQFDRVVVPVQFTQATNSTLTVTMSAWFGLYTKNVSTLSLLHSQSGTYSINGSGTASSNQNSGPKNMTFPWTTTVTDNYYWLGFVSRTTTAGNNATLSNFVQTQQASVWSGLMGQAVAASCQYVLGLGTYSATTSAMPASIGFNQLTGSGSIVQRPPMIWFLSQTA